MPVTGQPHFDKLLEGPEAWNAWRHQHPAEIPELTGVTLPLLLRRELTTADGHGIDLTSARLSGADLRFAGLSNADFSHADLRDADLSGACLRGAIFDGADLTSVSFGTADLGGATFDGAILDGACMSQARHLNAWQVSTALSARRALLPDGIETPPGEADGAASDAPPPPPPVRRARPDLYALLGVSPEATGEEIQAAYHTVAKVLHPDRAGGGDSTDDAFKCAKAAADILLDRRKRRLYNRRELDAQGDRLPEAAAGEARSRRHGAFAAAFLLGLLVLPAVYVAMKFTRPQQQHMTSVIPQPVPVPRELETGETGAGTPVSREEALPASVPVTAAMTPEAAPSAPPPDTAPAAVRAVPGPNPQSEAASASREPDQAAPGIVPPPESPAAPGTDIAAHDTRGAAPPTLPRLTGEEEKVGLSEGEALIMAGKTGEARALFARLAERGSANAAFAMAWSYEDGPEPDSGMALYWFSEAARLAEEAFNRK